MNTEQKNELARMTVDIEQAAVLLNRLVAELKATMGYTEVPGAIMNPLFNAQIELDNAIERYVAMHDEWVEVSA